METHYDTLCISPGATGEEIRQAYKSLLLAVHPDKRVSQDVSDNSHMARISVIQEAYSVLKDPESRARYDMEIRWKQVYQDQSEVFDRVMISDMEVDASDRLTYPCRCGDVFKVEESLLAGNGNHEYIICCSSCSLSLVLMVHR